MTERTFTKDLNLLTQTFRQFAVTKNFDLSELLLFDQLLYPEVLEPVYEFHTQFLKDLEMRLFYWYVCNLKLLNFFFKIFNFWIFFVIKGRTNPIQK